ncbi:MAG: response regulator [Oceanospirillaceae bacterium]|nr:response regulator [Oceanospirillaceae bacterium]
MKRSVLIIDDDQFTVEAAREMLAPYYKLFFAIEAKTGLNIALRHKPDLILLDLKMPKLGGFEFIEAYRKAADDEMPFIVMSAHTSDEMKHRADELGVLYFIEKPLNATFLPLAIEAIFEGLDLQKQQGISSKQ